jgi:glycosyltransferase involved in cell wall biosynthesis
MPDRAVANYEHKNTPQPNCKKIPPRKPDRPAALRGELPGRIGSDMTKQAGPAGSRAPRVSLGLPVYNGEQWLDATLGSLRAQTFGEFELLISDNASEDGTRELCLRHAAADPRIKYERNASNIGANRNYVAVLDRASAPYFKWASSNDLCAPDFLARCVETLDRRPDAVLVYPRANVFVDDITDATPYDEDIAVEDGRAAERFRRLLEHMRLNNAFNGLMRTDWLRRALPMASFWSADVVLMAELALLGKYVLLPERSFFRRMSVASATRLRSPEDVTHHFEPHARKPLLWQQWKFHARLLRVAIRSAPPGRDWLECVGYALRALVWARIALADDVMQAARRVQ